MTEVYSKNQYFEAVLQLRPYDEEVLKAVEKMVAEREGVFISKVVKQKTGLDLYLSSQKFAQIIGKKLKKRFNGELKLSRTLFTRNRLTSKDIYRVTVLFRLKGE
ncbi:MAG: NMD3-related protein [Candidatus Woesearchaeota archaeon]